jgi:hypothetical protein
MALRRKHSLPYFGEQGAVKRTRTTAGLLGHENRLVCYQRLAQIRRYYEQNGQRRMPIDPAFKGIELRQLYVQYSLSGYDTPKPDYDCITSVAQPPAKTISDSSGLSLAAAISSSPRFGCGAGIVLQPLLELASSDIPLRATCHPAAHRPAPTIHRDGHLRVPLAEHSYAAGKNYTHVHGPRHTARPEADRCRRRWTRPAKMRHRPSALLASELPSPPERRRKVLTLLTSCILKR